jgi:hypothetical protein
MRHSKSYIINALLLRGRCSGSGNATTAASELRRHTITMEGYQNVASQSPIYLYGYGSGVYASSGHLPEALSDRPKPRTAAAKSLSQRGRPNTWMDKLWKASDHGVLTEEYSTRTISSGCGFPAIMCILTRSQYPGYSGSEKTASIVDSPAWAPNVGDNTPPNRTAPLVLILTRIRHT